jgi:hypothetical protein
MDENHKSNHKEVVQRRERDTQMKCLVDQYQYYDEIPETSSRNENLI